MWPNPQFPADLVTFTEKIRNVKLQFLCSAGFVVDEITAKDNPDVANTINNNDTMTQVLKSSDVN